MGRGAGLNARGMRMLKRMLAALLGCLVLGTAPGFANETIHVGEGPFISGGPFFIARDRGYFAKVGLDVDARIFNDGALAVPSMVSGELDVTLVTLSAGLFNSIAKGAPMVIFLDRGNNNTGRGGSAINVSNAMYDAGLKGPADLAMLKGKRIGVTAVGSINQYEIALALQKAGLDPRTDVQWITNVSQPDLVKMLGRNLVDATDLAWQFGAVAQDQKFGPLIMDGGTVDPGGQVAAYAARRQYLADHRDAVVRFAMAIMYAAKEFNAAAGDPAAHPDTVALLAKAVMSGKTDMLTSFAPHWTATSEDGAPNADAIMRMQDFWIDTFHMGTQKVPVDQLVDLSVAREARQRLETQNPFTH
jgi:NitT/TauT family transport system substrate-binding protein